MLFSPQILARSKFAPGSGSGGGGGGGGGGTPAPNGATNWFNGLPAPGVVIPARAMGTMSYFFNGLPGQLIKG